MKYLGHPFVVGCAIALGVSITCDLPAKEGERRRGIWAKPDAEDVAYGDEKRQRLDIFTPAGTGEDAGLPVLLFVHGGAWRIGDKNQHGFLGRVFADEGFVAVTINYRLHPEVVFPAFVEDGAKAVGWLRENIAKFGGDPEKIFLMGHSAGAHIVSLLGSDERYLDSAVGAGDRPWLRGVIPVAGPHLFDPSKVRSLKPIFGEFAATKRPSPAAFIDGEEPPYLVMFAGKDQLVAVKQGREMESAIRRAKGEVEISFHPEMGHIQILTHFSPQLAPDSPLRGIVAGFIRKWSE